MLFFSICAEAQNTNDWYLSKILNDNNGLPQNSIRSMYYDTATNFLWLATEAGLVRYDGVNAKVFDQRDMPYLQSMRIHNLVPTITGEVIGCNLLGETFTLRQNYPLANTDSQLATLQSIGYRRGNIKSLQALPMEREALSAEKGQQQIVYERLWINDSTWFAESDSGIYMIHNSHIIYRWPKTKKIITPYFINRGKQLYAINSNGHGYCIDVVHKHQRTTTVTSRLLAFTGNLVFYSDILGNRRMILNGKELHEVLFTNDTVYTRLVALLPEVPAYITSIAFDKSGRYLFIATSATGLYIYQHSSFTIYTASASGADNNNYGSVLVDSNHILTNQLRLFNMSDGSSKKIAARIGSNSMAMDTSGHIWHGDYVSSFSLKQPDKLVLASSTGMDVFVTGYRSLVTGRLWIGTGNYLGYANGRDMKRLIKYREGQSFYFITETPAGQLIGISNSGIHRVDTINKKIISELINPLVSQIRTVHVDSANRCWIGTYGKGIFLYHLKNKKLTRLPVDDKGYLQYSHVFIDDGNGNFLVPTNKGLFKLSKSNLLQIDANPLTPLYYQYFDTGDGLLTNEFNGGCQPAYNRLPNGDIVIPALQGLVRVKMRELPSPVSSLLFIDKIETRRNSYNSSDTLRFEKDERVQTWSLSFAQWGRPNSQGIFYKIDNDTIWQRLPAGENNIQLTELNGGKHTLIIRHQYGLQPHLFTTNSYPFYIDKYYYETVWFWLAVLLLLAGIIYFSVRIRNRQLIRKNVQLKEIIRQNTQDLSDKNGQLEETLLDLNEALEGLQDNSIFKNRLIGLLGHDLLGPLRFIAGIADHLNSDAATLSAETTKENTAEISNTATELLYLGESLIQWIKLLEGSFRLIVQPIDLRNLTEEIMQVHRPIAAFKKNGLHCAIPAGTCCHYDPILLKVILHNLLLNANKFTSGGQITIDALITETELQMQVQDSGAGMNPAMVASLNNLKPVPSQMGTHKETGFGMGYMLIIDLLRFAEGKLQVESEMSKGTIVGFTLPLQNAELHT